MTCAMRAPAGWAYPRSCGATFAGAQRLARDQGLSPLARGNLALATIRSAALGPIPARAGQP